jgi:hypothetical protein
MPGDDHNPSTIGRIQGEAKYIAPLLGDIAAQASEADRTRSVAPNVITSIKKNDIMRISASHEISGIEESIVVIANELCAIAPRSGSTAWCLWNHGFVFHHSPGAVSSTRGLPQSLQERGRGAARYHCLLRVLQLPTIAPGVGLPHPTPGLRRSSATSGAFFARAIKSVSATRRCSVHWFAPRSPDSVALKRYFQIPWTTGGSASNAANNMDIRIAGPETIDGQSDGTRSALKGSSD